jgi:hypothetical protein
MNKKDCSNYEDCLDTTPLEIKVNNSFLEILMVGCWGVYCETGDRTILKDKKGDLVLNKINRGQRDVSKLLYKYTKVHPNIKDMFLAGDNVYQLSFEPSDEKAINSHAKILSLYLKEPSLLKSFNYDVKKQISEGFEMCFNNVGIDRFFVAIGNHDIENCEILNYQKNYTNGDNKLPNSWIFPSLYYNVVYNLKDDVSVNVIVLDTNMFEKEAVMCNGKPFSEEMIKQQEKWAKSFTNFSYTIVVGHIPCIAVGHKEDKPVFNKRLEKLIREIKPIIYFCADEHNQQFIYNEEDGISFIIAGSGGTELDPLKNYNLPKGYSFKYGKSTYGFVSLGIDKEGIKIKYLTVGDGEKAVFNLDDKGKLLED